MMRATPWARSFTRRLGTVWLVAAVAAMLSACNPVADDNPSAVIAIVSNVNDGSPLNSDVRISTATGSSVREDEVAVTLQTIRKSTAGEISDLYTVQFLEVTVVYTRPDGNNEPGVDVPFPLVMGMSVAVEPDSEETVTVTVVTNQQKLEPPLRNLWFLGGELEIDAIASLQFLGRDQAGNNVAATGRLQIHFADFADNQ